MRGLDEIHLIDSLGNLILTTNINKDSYKAPTNEALEMVFNDERPLKIINAFENRSAAIIKLNPYSQHQLHLEL